MSDHDAIDYNWAALALAIVAKEEINSEIAVKKILGPAIRKTKEEYLQETKQMAAMKAAGSTWAEIGDAMGIYRWNAALRVENYLKKQAQKFPATETETGSGKRTRNRK